MRLIKLTKGKFAIVDDEDFHSLNQFKWCFDGKYAQTNIKGKHIRMHKKILPAEKGKQCDHINGNRLDNRKINLRNVTFSQNHMNRGTAKHGYKGIQPTESGKWLVSIGFNKNSIYIGTFQDKFHAAIAYDLWARDLFGSYAKLNLNQ